MTKPFTFHIDAGHCWLEVTSTDLNKLGLEESDFSPYSYKEPAWRPFDLARLNNTTYYLEEDCDASTFIKCVGDKAEIEFKERECDSTFNVRALPRNR